MEKTWSLYRHTFPDGKVYIGITGGDPLARWNNGNGYMNTKKMSEAIVRYGWDNIKHEILMTGLTEKEARDAERTTIKTYRYEDILNTVYRNEKPGDAWLKKEKQYFEVPEKAYERIAQLVGTHGYVYSSVSANEIELLCSKVTSTAFMTFNVFIRGAFEYMTELEFYEWLQGDFDFEIRNLKVQDIEKFKASIKLFEDACE